MKKWTFFIRAVLLLLMTGVLCLFYGFFFEPKTLQIRRIDIVSPNWSGEPIRIGLFADIHIGGVHMPPDRVTNIVTKMNAEVPDIILLAGDYVNGHTPIAENSDDFNEQISSGVTELGNLSAPLGVYAVIGNHDNWYSGRAVSELLLASNITVLDNQAAQLENNALCIVGLADEDTDTPDRQAFDGCIVGQNILALMHSPDSFNYIRSDTSIALAGHTHGGQINLPFIGRRVTATTLGEPYAYGQKDWSGIPVFITSGLGTSILPARFRAPPEIVILTLRSED